MDVDLKDIENEINSIHISLQNPKPKHIVELFTIKKKVSEIKSSRLIESDDHKYLNYLHSRIRLEEILFDMKKFRMDHFDFLEIRDLLLECNNYPKYGGELHYFIILYYLSNEFINKKYFKIAKTLLTVMKSILSNSKEIANRNQHESYSQVSVEKYLQYVMYSIEKHYLSEILKCYKSLIADPNLKSKLAEIKNFDIEKSEILKKLSPNYQEQKFLVDHLSNRAEAKRVIDVVVSINDEMLKLLIYRNDFKSINQVNRFHIEEEIAENSSLLLEGNLFFDLIGFAGEIEEQLEIFQTASGILINSLAEYESKEYIELRIVILQKIVWAVRCILTVREIVNINELANGIKIDDFDELVPKILKYGNCFVETVEEAGRVQELLENYFDVIHFMFRISKQYTANKELPNLYAKKMATTIKKYPGSGDKYFQNFPMKINSKKRNEDSLAKFILDHDHKISSPICSVNDLRRIFGIS